MWSFPTLTKSGYNRTGQTDMTKKQTYRCPSPIVAFTGYIESMGTSCPHCGAVGKRVWTFLCEDGVERGAMAGCLVKGFSTSQRRTRRGELVTTVTKKLVTAQRSERGITNAQLWLLETLISEAKQSVSA